MSAKFKVGLIGAGGIARGVHMPGWLAVKGAEVVAVADVNEASARKLAADFKIPAAYRDYRELLKHKDIDAVDICAPNQVHTPAALASFKAGKHVLCEKPLATTLDEVLRLGDASRKARRMLMTAQHQRFGAMAVAAKKWITAGNLGKVYHSRIHAVRRNWIPTTPGFIDKRLSGGGPCMDIGVHALDLGLHLMDFPKPVRVTGTSRVNFAKGDVFAGAWGEWDRKLFSVEDFAAGFVHFKDGSTMVLEASWLQHQGEDEDMSSRLFGMKAGLEWPSGRYATTVRRVNVDGHLKPVNGLKAAHTEEIIAFHKAVTSGLPSPVPVEQTAVVIAILEGVMKSNKSGREEKIAL